ncbi:MAG: MBL fold metallo-hydrolase [Pseudomonadales bacterium]|nr:MBL fold metallo-hydrolase [Pseudomonadales bacterium]
MLELITLGTSSGVPTRYRNVSATAIKLTQSKKWLLQDCGEGTQHQLLRTPLSLQQLDAILITHVHGDHCYGLPGLLASASLQGRKRKLMLIGPRDIKLFIDAVMQFTGLYLTFELEFIDVESVSVLDLSWVRVDRATLSHRVASYAYGYETVPTRPGLDVAKLRNQGIPEGAVWGQLSRGESVNIPDRPDLGTIQGSDYLLPPPAALRAVVAGDNDTPECLRDFLRNASLLIHESTYTQAIAEKVGPGPQHSSARLIARFAEKMKLPHLVLTHFSSRYLSNPNAEQSIRHIQEEATSSYSGWLSLAEDFDCYRIDEAGKVLKRSSSEWLSVK